MSAKTNSTPGMWSKAARRNSSVEEQYLQSPVDGSSCSPEDSSYCGTVDGCQPPAAAPWTVAKQNHKPTCINKHKRMCDQTAMRLRRGG